MQCIIRNYCTEKHAQSKELILRSPSDIFSVFFSTTLVITSKTRQKLGSPDSPALYYIVGIVYGTFIYKNTILQLSNLKYKQYYLIFFILHQPQLLYFQ